MITLLHRPVPLSKRLRGTSRAARLALPPSSRNADFPNQPAIASSPASVPIPPINDAQDRDQVEAHMNAWLQNVTQRANDQKMQAYQQALTEWQAGSRQCQASGLPLPAEPAPPSLDPVQAMPAGWWFLT